MQAFDIIGDIHGQAQELKKLLLKLGYQEINEIYQHPERKVIFLGDFIDRGDMQRQVIEIVRPIDYFLKNKKEITYKEVTTYENPTKWSDPDGVTVSEGGRVATRIRTEPNTGRISNAWSLDENDSRGKVKVDVYVDDQLIQTFHSEVK